MRKIVYPIVLWEAYNSGKTLQEVADEYGYSRTGVWKIIRRIGERTRTPKEAAPASAIKRSGDNHPRRKNPPSIGTLTYRSQRIVDEDGQPHKRRVHVIKMEKKIKRRLFLDECVHHINGDRHDNRIENLMLMKKSDHASMEINLAHRLHPEKFVRDGKGKFTKGLS